MGIPSWRFLDRPHDQFTCTICLDVSADPFAVNGCDHIFCQSCINSDKLVKCPTCQSEFKDPKWEGIKGTIARIYYDLRMKCLNPSCDKVLTPSDYENHDENCPITFETCKDCEFKIRRGPNNDHSSIHVLKAEIVANNKIIEEMEKKMKTEVEKMKYKNKRIEGMVRETEKRMEIIEEHLLGSNEKIEELEKRIQLESTTVESLIDALRIFFKEM